MREFLGREGASLCWVATRSEGTNWREVVAIEPAMKRGVPTQKPLRARKAALSLWRERVAMLGGFSVGS